MTNEYKTALWSSYILGECLREADGDLTAAFSAASHILSTQPIPTNFGNEEAKPIPPPVDPPSSPAFSVDVHSKHAQLVLGRSLKAIKKLTSSARRELESALKKVDKDGGTSIAQFLDKYRRQLAKVLTTAQLASVLEGMREIASTIPPVATFPGAVAPPPSLEPKEAIELVGKISKLKDEARATAIYDLPEDQQTYVNQVIAAKEAGPIDPPPPLSVALPSGEGPEDIHLVTIDNAVRELSTKNVLTRQMYDQISNEAKAKAFTVAGVEVTDTLTQIRDTLAENIAKGADYETFREKVLESMDSGTFLSPAHMETLFRTNVQTAFSDGQAAILGNPIVRSGFPYATYDSIHDDRTRENHRELESRGIDGSNVYRINDPVFQTFRPPWDYNDRCNWTPITVRQAAEAGVNEAKRWLETGKEPSPPAFVQMPPFAPPAGFKRSVSSMPMSIRLSMQPLDLSFSPDAYLTNRPIAVEEDKTLSVESEEPSERKQGDSGRAKRPRFGRIGCARSVDDLRTDSRELGAPETSRKANDRKRRRSRPRASLNRSYGFSREGPVNDPQPSEGGPIAASDVRALTGSRTESDRGLSQDDQTVLVRRSDISDDLRAQSDGRGAPSELAGGANVPPREDGGENLHGNSDLAALSVDEQGNVHRGKGEGGGQFVSKGGAASTTGAQARKKSKKHEGDSESSGAQEGKKPSKLRKAVIGLFGKALSLGKKAGALEHFAAHWVAERIESLPKALRLPLKGAYYAAFSVFIIGQKAAKEVAREVDGDDHADRVGATLATFDNISAVTAKIASLSGVHGPTAIPLILPVASTSYLAYSLVRHPVATYNAATKAVDAVWKKVAKEAEEQEVESVAASI